MPTCFCVGGGGGSGGAEHFSEGEGYLPLDITADEETEGVKQIYVATATSSFLSYCPLSFVVVDSCLFFFFSSFLLFSLLFSGFFFLCLHPPLSSHSDSHSFYFSFSLCQVGCCVVLHPFFTHSTLSLSQRNEFTTRSQEKKGEEQTAVDSRKNSKDTLTRHPLPSTIHLPPPFFPVTTLLLFSSLSLFILLLLSISLAFFLIFLYDIAPILYLPNLIHHIWHSLTKWQRFP